MLINFYKWQNLLNLGAKKFAIVGIPPIGCCPFQRAALNQTAGAGATTASGCLDPMNVAAQMLNTELQSLLQKLSSQHADMMYSFGNTFDMTKLVIGNPPSGKYYTSILVNCSLKFT